VLLDTSTVHSGRLSAAPITVPLGTGHFDAPVATGAAVVLVNQTTRQILTYTSQGTRQSAITVPPSNGSLYTSRGEDRRIYVDNAAGTQMYIVDGDGSITGVDTSKGPGGPPTPPGPPVVTPPAGAPAPPAPPARPSPPSAPPSTPTPTPTPPTPIAQVPDAPATVGASPGDGQITVTWTTPADNGSGLTNYLVSWRGGSVTVSAAQLRTTITGLTDGTPYVVRVAARNSVGLGPATAAAAVTPTATLHAPASVTATANPNGAVALSWPGQSRAGVQYTVTSGGSTIAKTGATSATVSGLTLGQSYRFTVAASDGTKSLATTSGAVTPYRAPGAPTNLHAAPATGQVGLTWAAAPANGSRITGYTVSGAGSRTVTTTSTTVTGLQSGQTYTFTVVANGTDPNGRGTRVTGPAASVAATAVTVTKPALTITSTSVDANRHLNVVVDVDSGGDANNMCRITFLGVTQDKPCPHGQDTLVHDGVNIGQDNNIPFTVTPHNAAGDGDPQVGTVSTGNSGNHATDSVGARGLPPARVRRRRRPNHAAR
jgi:hypothetical protein